MLTMHLKNLEYFSVFGVGLVRHTANIKTEELPRLRMGRSP